MGDAHGNDELDGDGAFEAREDRVAESDLAASRIGNHEETPFLVEDEAGSGALTRIRGTASVAVMPKPKTIADTIPNPTQASIGGLPANPKISAARTRATAMTRR